jgi:branched-chain amino acid aminotransferase
LVRSKAAFVWFNGRIVPWEDAKVHVLTHAFNYGTAAFEGIRAYPHQEEMLIFRLDDHLKRLLRSCSIYGFDIPVSKEELASACVKVIGANDFHEPVYIRPLVYVSGTGVGISFEGYPIEVAVVAVPFSSYFGVSRGVDAMVSSWRKTAASSLPAEAKITGQYTNSVLAKMEALRNGFNEAILLDPEGLVCEGSAENIFLVRDGKLVTPPVNAGILEGITRDTVIKIANEEGIPIQERDVTRSELYTCDEAFFAGTAVEVTPIRSIDRKVIGDGAEGPITKRISHLYQSAVIGKLPGHDGWVTPVYSSRVWSAAQSSEQDQ